MGIIELWIKFHIIIIDYQMFMYQMNAYVLAICINNCQRHLLTLSWAALKGQSVASVVSVINDSDFLTFLLWPLSKILFFWKKKLWVSRFFLQLYIQEFTKIFMNYIVSVLSHLGFLQQSIRFTCWLTSWYRSGLIFAVFIFTSKRT